MACFIEEMNIKQDTKAVRALEQNLRLSINQKLSGCLEHARNKTLWGVLL